MTFHVLYNDCHLEAHMEKESMRKRATEGRAERGGGREGRREKVGGSQWMKMA